MTAVIRGLYHNCTIISQFYLTVRSIINGINTLDKPYTATKLNAAVKPAAESAGTIIDIKYYTGSTAFLYITNHRQ